MRQQTATITIGNTTWSGFDQVEITCGIEQAARTAVFQATLDVNAARRMAFDLGDEVLVDLNGERILTGYLTARQARHDRASMLLTLTARSKTGDIIDSEALPEPAQHKKVTLLQFARALCEPFDVDVTAEAAIGGVQDSISINPGETVYTAIERQARQIGVLLTDDANGDLVLTSSSAAGRAASPLVLGDNILAADYADHDDTSFSPVIVSATPRPGRDGSMRDVLARATDSTVSRYRPMLLQLERGSSIAQASARANWEVNTRRARSQSLTITTQGWDQTDTTSIWQPNQRVRVVDPLLDIEADYLIGACRYMQDGRAGTRTMLFLYNPAGYDPEPLS